MKKRFFLLLTLIMTIAPLFFFVAEIATGRSDGMTSSTLALTIEQKQSFDAQNVELIGQIGGSVEAVAVKDALAYVGIGPRLVILDISNPSNPTKVGQTEALPGQINDIVISGNYAYVVTSGSGLHIIDVSNQFAPSQVGTFDNGYTYGVAVANNIAYLVNAVGLRLINVSNPATPTQIALLELSGANGVAVADNYAYVTVTDWNNDSGGLHIINVSNSQAPTEVRALDIGKAFSVAVANNYAYVITQSSLSVVNVANPTTASQVGTLDISFASDVTVVGNYAYVADGSSLRIINVSNPQAPNEMKDQYIQGNAKSIVVSNNIALVASSQGGLQLVNVTNPSNASRLSTFESWMAAGVAVAGDYAYVANGWNGGLHAINVANPAALSEVGSSNTDEENWTDWRRMSIANNNAYLAGGDLSIININSPFAPSEVGTLDTPGNPYGGGVAIAGQMAYLADGEDGGLRIIDINNSSAPSQVGALDTPGNARDVAVVGNYAYVADGDAGGLRIIDITRPSAPREVGFHNTPGDAYGVAVVGNYAYVAEGRAGGLRIIDISNPQAPFQQGAINTSGWANDVTVVGNLAYVADHHKGLRIIDVTDPIAPREVGYFDTPGIAINVTIANGYAYVADRHGGLVVLRYSENTPTPTPTATPMPTRTPTPPPSSLNLKIDQIEISQAIQRPDNSVPLVTNRPAIARVYVGVQNSPSAVNGVTAVLHAARNGTELANSPIAPFNRSFTAPLNPNREQVEHTLNFQLPLNWTTESELTLWAEVNPTQSVNETNYNDNRSTDYNLTFDPAPRLQVVLVPVAYQKNGSGPVYRPNMNSSNNFGLGTLQRIFPIANIEYTIHSEYAFKGDMGTDEGWSQLLREIDQLRLRERASQGGTNSMPKYYGVLPMDASHWGGLGYRPGNSSIGLVEQDDVAAHEIGHNLGLRHVDCGNPSGTDPNYPYFDGAIGQVGLDVYQREVISASQYKDLMSYCRPRWISDYNYNKILNALISQSRQTMPVKGLEDGLLISGQINPDGTGSLDNAEPISNANLVIAPGLGNYRIELYDQSDMMQFSYAFDPVEIASEDKTPLPSDFGFVVPHIDNLASIQLWQGSTRLASLNAAVAPPDLNASLIKGSGADANEVTIEWRVGSNRLNGGESPITVNVRYSADEGQSWQTLVVQQTSDSSLSLNKTQLAASENGLLEIAAHNSTQSQIHRLELGKIENKAPQVGIVVEEAPQLYPGEALILTGAAMDLEDGGIPDEKLVWSEARMGELGTGPTLVLSEGLSAGQYTIKLTATDTDGNSAQDTLSIVVQNENYQLHLPLIIR